MSTTRRMGRLGMLAVGLGIGVTLAVTPGTASATTDIDISIDGMDVFNGGGTATATSGMGDFAIAIGPNSDAVADGGFGDVATAFSTGDSGVAALAGTEIPTDTGNNFDFASAFGNGAVADAGNHFDEFPNATASSFDSASAVGFGGNSAPATADAGFNGSGDYASAVGDHTEALAGLSDFDPANSDYASVWSNLFAPTTNVTDAVAGEGLGNGGGSNDLAFTIDPFGTLGSEALAGAHNNFDLAGALGDALNVNSILSDFIAHIAPFF